MTKGQQALINEDFEQSQDMSNTANECWQLQGYENNIIIFANVCKEEHIRNGKLEFVTLMNTFSFNQLQAILLRLQEHDKQK